MSKSKNVRKIEKVDDHIIDNVARTVGMKLSDMLTRVDDNNHTNPIAPVNDSARACTFCGGAGEVETMIEDYMGSTIVITINCPHRKP